MNRNLVYTLKWPGDRMPAGLAMNCHMHGGQLWYFDTLRGHMIDGVLLEDGNDAFLFESHGYAPGTWEFRKLTIGDFQNEVWKIVENSGIILRTIHTTDELQAWYRETFGEEAGLDDPD